MLNLKQQQKPKLAQRLTLLTAEFRRLRQEDCCQFAASPVSTNKKPHSSPRNAGLRTAGRTRAAGSTAVRTVGTRAGGAPRDALVTCSAGRARRLPVPGEQRGRATEEGSRAQARDTQGPPGLHGAGQQPGQAAQALHGAQATGRPQPDAGPACRNPGRYVYRDNRAPRLREPSPRLRTSGHACSGVDCLCVLLLYPMTDGVCVLYPGWHLQM